MLRVYVAAPLRQPMSHTPSSSPTTKRNRPRRRKPRALSSCEQINWTQLGNPNLTLSIHVRKLWNFEQAFARILCLPAKNAPNCQGQCSPVIARSERFLDLSSASRRRIVCELQLAMLVRESKLADGESKGVAVFGFAFCCRIGMERGWFA